MWHLELSWEMHKNCYILFYSICSIQFIEVKKVSSIKVVHCTMNLLINIFQGSSRQSCERRRKVWRAHCVLQWDSSKHCSACGGIKGQGWQKEQEAVRAVRGLQRGNKLHRKSGWICPRSCSDHWRTEWVVLEILSKLLWVTLTHKLVTKIWIDVRSVINKTNIPWYNVPTN